MLSGGPISRRIAVFSGDGKLLIAPCGQEVRLYATATGEQVGQLEGHSGEVTCVAANTGEDQQVYSTSRDGTLRLWDLTTLKCLKIWAVRETVRHMVIHATLRLAYMSIEWRDNEAGRIISWDLVKGKAGNNAMKTRIVGPLAMHSQGSLVATIDKHLVMVWKVGPISQPLRLHHTKPFTCVAISADEAVVAAGDISGRILIWHDVAASLASSGPRVLPGGTAPPAPAPAAPPLPPCTTVHWHSGPVACLAFSEDGVYLRSGGREGVLVSWRMEDNRPNFLPRLGGAVLGMSSCASESTLLLLRQADNTLRVINVATNKVVSSVLGLRPQVPHLSHATHMAATCLQPSTGLLCVPTHNAVLQFYDTTHHRHVAMLQVAPRNEVSASQPVLPIASDQEQHMAHVSRTSPYVSLTGFTRSGACLATVDVRPSPGVPGVTSSSDSESCLKFWEAHKPGQTKSGREEFSLNTVVDDPHRGPVTCLAAHPTLDLVVTAGGGAATSQSQAQSSPPEFKVWERVAMARRPGSKVESPSCWRCRSVGSYRGQPFTSASFSPDGSLLALAAGPKVTLWDPLSCTLVATLPAPPELQQQAVLNLAFIAGAPFLVGSTGNALAVWNLLTASVQWAAPLCVANIAADPVHPRFVAVVAALQSPHRPAAKQETTQTNVSHRPGQAKAPKPKDRPAVASTSQPPLPAGQQQQQQQQQADVAEPGGRQAEVDGGASQQQPAQAGGSGQPSVEEQPRSDKAVGQAPAGGLVSWVLVFDPRSPAPLQMGCVPSSSVQLLFPAATAAAASGGGEAQQLSQLLVLTAEREYVVLGQGGDGDSVAAEGSGQGGAAMPKPAGPSAFEAGFGVLAPQAGGDATMVDGEGQDAGAGGPAAPWRKLLNSPSHILPAPSTLASMFLRSLTEVQ